MLFAMNVLSWKLECPPTTYHMKETSRGREEVRKTVGSSLHTDGARQALATGTKRGKARLSLLHVLIGQENNVCSDLLDPLKSQVKKYRNFSKHFIAHFVN